MKKKHNSALRSSALQITFISLSAVLLTLPAAPATATPCVSTVGYWMNHPNAWCIQNIQLGCRQYTEAQAIAIINRANGGDRTYNLAAQLIAAKLNTFCGGASCVASAITSADTWLCQHPVGSNVTAGSPAWQQISSTFDTLTSYNQGQLCAPHCN